MPDMSLPSQPRLPFPTEILSVHGGEVEEYIIPDDRKAEVLEQLYLFEDVPSLDEEMYDLHAQKLFTVGDFRVTREGDMNFLVSPYYPDSGGTVIDWMPPEFAEQD